LTNLLRKDGYVWSEEATIAFQALKGAVTTAPIFAFPYFELNFEIEIDTLSIGIGVFIQ